MWHAGSCFPSQGSNPLSLHWKYRIFTAGSPGSPFVVLLFTSDLNHLDRIVIYDFAGVGFGIDLPAPTIHHCFCLYCHGCRNYLVLSLCLIDPLAAFNNGHLLKMPSSASLLHLLGFLLCLSLSMLFPIDSMKY